MPIRLLRHAVRTTKRSSVIALVALGWALVLVGVAQAGPVKKAEGDFASSISGARTGFESRSWSDKNLDNNNSYVYFETCRDSVPATGDNADVGLYRHRPGVPDASIGIKTLNCYNNDTGNWGDVSSGSYHFTIKKIRGQSSGYSISVNYVQVGY